jgi:NAD+ diphosphatase
VPAKQPNAFASGSVDRVSDRRRDDEWVLARLHDGEVGLVHVMWQGRLAVQGDRAAPVPYATVRDLQGAFGPVLLGEFEGASHFVLDLSHVDRSALENRLHADTMLTGLRESSGKLHNDHANLLAFASGITTWHNRSRFCGVCGAETEVRDAGHMRKCPACGAEHFPRTDPAVIMLVVDGDRCVMGRQKVWPGGMFSTLAGFVEPGESLEDAVAREVLEEVGVQVTDVTYHSSQPWPFPQSIMLGFHARYVSGELAPNQNELEDAQWFTAADLRSGFPKTPPPTAIAGRLVADWLASVD